jgi:hypothetical protein
MDYYNEIEQKRFIYDGKFDAIISILETMDSIESCHLDKINKIKTLICIPEIQTTITTKMLFDAWKMKIFVKEFHDPVHHVNGWIFIINRFRNDISQEEYRNKDGRVSINIYISKDILEGINDDRFRTQEQITKEYFEFDKNFGSGKPFWKYSKLKFIDFDDCYISDLQPFLEWCDNHKAIELL